MSSFRPLNVIFEEESEDDIDDSKEIQTEEALKLYQIALKLHSQGPQYYEETDAAYQELFRSEIFTYPESLSESRWLELYGDADTGSDADDADDDAPVEPAVLTTSSDGTPNTLPQILYLAYKNHGLFRLDQLQHRLTQIEMTLQADDNELIDTSLPRSATTGLEDFAEALGRDETDLELWRRVSRVSEYLGSQRLARYCLEAVIDTGDAALNDQSGTTSLEELFAREQLRSLLPKIQDAVSEAALENLPKTQKSLARALRKHVDPCAFLPEAEARRLVNRDNGQAKTVEYSVPLRSWSAIGKAILHAIQQSAQGVENADPGSSYTLSIPARQAATSWTTTDTDCGPKPALLQQLPVTENGRQVDEVLLSPTEAFAQSDGASPTFPVTSTINGVQENEPAHNLGSSGEQQKDSPGPSISLPTRKRSSGDAELLDPTDAGRSRSKRIKARTSTTDPSPVNGESAEEWARWFAEQLEIYVQADEHAFESADQMAIKLGRSAAGTFERLKQASVYAPQSPADDQESDSDDIAIRALKLQLDTWNMAKSRALLHGNALYESSKGSQDLGFSALLEQSVRETRAGHYQNALSEDFEIDWFVHQVQVNPSPSLHELAFRWLRHFLVPDVHDYQKVPLYESHLWSDTLKETIVQMLVQADEYILQALQDSQERSAQLVQPIFELHLDIYGRITNPSSIVDDDTRTLQRDRLCRWASLASETLNAKQQDEGDKDAKLMIRLLWFTVVCNDLVGSSTSDHTVICYRDLIRLLQAEAPMHNKSDAIRLVNNALIPEISVAAAEKEISRLTTMDYFTNIFRSDHEDPFTVVDNLEPLLTLSLKAHCATGEDLYSNTPSTPKDHVGNEPDITRQTSRDVIQEADQFLHKASVSVRLFLWQKLRDAYSVINYPSMILSCNLRCLALLVQQLRSKSYAISSHEHESETYLHCMHNIDDFLTSALAIVMTDANAFECIDYDHVCSLTGTLGSLIRIVHAFALWEDSIRVGQVNPAPQPTPTAIKAQLKCAEKFRDLMVKSWTLRYYVFREGIKQNEDMFDTPSLDLLNTLKLTHNVLGLRTYCGLANRVFLKTAKSETLRLKPQEGWDMDMPQIMFDLYGLKISPNATDAQDHLCEPIEIDKTTANEVLDILMLHVNRMAMKDLLKSDLRYAVDRLQQVIKAPKIANSLGRTFNKRLVGAYLKSPINPIDLFRSFRGVSGLSCAPARTDGWEVAQRGWYFLLGHMALAKFRTRRKESPSSTEDLEIAKTFFKTDLEYDTEKWETWYRLGQAYDYHLEEWVTWAADKLENDQTVVVELQRQAILCYTMAVAIANRSAAPSFEDTTTMADLYDDFGTRIYSSTREPFSMRAFGLSDFERHYNGEVRGMYRGAPFRSLLIYPAWKLASTLLRQASLQKPNEWQIFYSLGKVLWKMHNCSDRILGHVKRIPHQSVIDAIVQAIECVPDKKDNKHPEKQPILQPHYKLLSIVHKLVKAERCSPEHGCHILKATHYSRKVPDIQDPEEWVDYVQEVLRPLRAADKSNWHHRMAFRAAQTIYETDPDDLRTWLGAKHEFTQQIFTKAMAVQVWKVEFERPGRHFVYTTRYVHFLVGILYKLKDKESIEILARRIRKRAGEFFDHAGLWQFLMTAYLTLLRQRVEMQAGIEFGTEYENSIFRNKNPEDFQTNAARIEAWVQNPANSCPYIDTLRDAIEFKKLNNTLSKATAIEECIGDIYALIYESNAQALKNKELEEEKRTRMRLNNILDDTTNHVMQLDGANFGGSFAQVEDPMAQYRRKLTSITHREIIRRAEALMIKPPPIATPRPAARTLPVVDPGKSPVVAVVIATHDAAREVISVPDSPQSLHDSADDESELSEVGDEGEDFDNDQDGEGQRKGSMSSMFPDLTKMQTDRFGLDGTSDVEIYDQRPADGTGGEHDQDGGEAAKVSFTPSTVGRPHVITGSAYYGGVEGLSEVAQAHGAGGSGVE